MDNEPALELVRLTKTFGDTVAVSNVSLEVPRGVVFGYLGPNGAGKTTTIRMLLGLIKPTSGGLRLNGFDAWSDRAVAHATIGYLPGNFVAYPDLTSTQYLMYLANLRGGVEKSEIDKLAERLDLHLTVKIGALSHGNLQKLGIIQAFMHHPELLILDEPTSGLDPLMQQEFLAMVREARAGGRTVFMSSHVLSEVDACADIVGMIDRGTLRALDRVDSLRGRAVRRMTLTFAGTPPAKLDLIDGVHDLTIDGATIRLTVEGSTSELLEMAAPHQIESITSTEPDLEEIFLDLYGGEG